MENSFGLMVDLTKDIGKMVNNLEKASIKIKKILRKKASGAMEKR
jgi:hypothetical protein